MQVAKWPFSCVKQRRDLSKKMAAASSRFCSVSEEDLYNLTEDTISEEKNCYKLCDEEL